MRPYIVEDRQWVSRIGRRDPIVARVKVHRYECREWKNEEPKRCGGLMQEQYVDFPRVSIVLSDGEWGN